MQQFHRRTAKALFLFKLAPISHHFYVKWKPLMKKHMPHV